MMVPKATQGGTTTMTIRPFVTASSLDDFDEKVSLSERTPWWERFQTLAFQGGWSDKMKVYELPPETIPLGKELAFTIITACTARLDEVLQGIQGEVL
ncbi:hypothetical protein PHMEG_00030255 [Phytophthora megakarya]|uniref:Uncharacterized protein n=1 Tax=Phytophthora megakarya TaxID=4795 RepID=A0A225V0Q6_9STRA|nr:hypothetical protein PHMEG_00030255 [Phytophthora megakarya]